jgi:hypothetical protein
LGKTIYIYIPFNQKETHFKENHYKGICFNTLMGGYDKILYHPNSGAADMGNGIKGLLKLCCKANNESDDMIPCQ